MANKTKKTELSFILTILISLFLLVLFLFFILEAYTITFSNKFNIKILLYIFLYIPVLVIPYFFWRLYKKWGRAYPLFLFFTLFYAISFFVFVKTISIQQKYRFFDPFLQMHPVLSDSIYVLKQDNEIRILFLGGSTTKCTDLPKNESFPERLKIKLQKQFPDKKITVFNAGMDWYTTRHSLITYTNYYKPFKADYVVCMHAINDVCRSFTPYRLASDTFKFDYSHFFGASGHAAFPDEAYPEKLINNFKYFFNVKIFNKKDIEVDFDASAFKSLPSYIYFYNLLLSEICKDGAIPIVLSEPYIYNDSIIDRKTFKLWFAEHYCYNQKENNYQNYNKKIASIKAMKQAMDTYNIAASQLASDLEIPFYDIEKHIPKTTAYFYDDVHYTDKGAAEMTDFLFLKIKNLIE